MNPSTKSNEVPPLPPEHVPTAPPSQVHPTREQFAERAKRGNLIPVHREVLADLETPVSAFRKIASSENAFLLESVEHGERFGRYSILGCDPHLMVRTVGDRTELIDAQGEVVETFREGDPLDALRAVMKRYTPVEDASLPPFTGGAVGYLSYDAVRHFERIPDSNPDTIGSPEMLFALTDTVMIFDHMRHTIRLVANAHVEDDGPDAAYHRALSQLDALQEKLKQPTP